MTHKAPKTREEAERLEAEQEVEADMRLIWQQGLAIKASIVGILLEGLVAKGGITGPVITNAETAKMYADKIAEFANTVVDGLVGT